MTEGLWRRGDALLAQANAYQAANRATLLQAQQEQIDLGAVGRLSNALNAAVGRATTGGTLSRPNIATGDGPRRRPESPTPTISKRFTIIITAQVSDPQPFYLRHVFSVNRSDLFSDLYTLWDGAPSACKMEWEAGKKPRYFAGIAPIDSPFPVIVDEYLFYTEWFCADLSTETWDEKPDRVGSDYTTKDTLSDLPIVVDAIASSEYLYALQDINVVYTVYYGTSSVQPIKPLPVDDDPYWEYDYSNLADFLERAQKISFNRVVYPNPGPAIYPNLPSSDTVLGHDDDNSYKYMLNVRIPRSGRPLVVPVQYL